MGLGLVAGLKNPACSLPNWPYIGYPEYIQGY